MKQKAFTQTLAIGLSTLLLGAQPAMAKDQTIELIGPDKSVRTFTIDSEHVVQFGGTSTVKTAVRKASATEQKQLKSLKQVGGKSTALKSADGGTLSPVLRDEAGRTLGLPGGLIVTFKGEVSEAEAQARLSEAGLTPKYEIAPSVWAVESPAGLETIELANKANAQGTFADVSPNWWTKRALK